MRKVETTEVIAVVARALNIAQASLHDLSSSEDVLSWDSLGHLHVCMALEEHFGIQVDMEKIAELDSIVKICEYLKTNMTVA